MSWTIHRIMVLYLYSSAVVPQRGKIKSSSYNSDVNSSNIPEIKLKNYIVRVQTWKVKGDQVAGNHRTEKKHCRNLYWKNKTTTKSLNEKQASILFPWKFPFHMSLSSDAKKSESRAVSWQSQGRDQSTAVVAGSLAELEAEPCCLFHVHTRLLLPFLSHMSYRKHQWRKSGGQKLVAQLSG